MRSVARNASEFRFICGRRGINRMFCCRVPKIAIHEVNLRQSFKSLGRQGNPSPQKLEWLLASNYLRCIWAVARKTDVLHGRVQLRWVVRGMRIVAKSARYVGGFMNVLVREFHMRQFFKRLWRQAHEPVKKRERLAALHYLAVAGT